VIGSTFRLFRRLQPRMSKQALADLIDSIGTPTP
jgi:hypothetical protein